MRSAILYSGISYQHYFLNRNNGKYKNRFDDIIYVMDLHETELQSYDYVVVPTRLNQDILLEHAGKFEDYLHGGGHLISFGDFERSWISHVRWKFYPTNFHWWVNPGADLPLYPVDPEHPLFQRITVDDAKWHYHGVFLPHDRVERILVNEIGEAIIYVDRLSYRGHLYMTTLDPDYHLGQGFIPKAETFLDGYLAWIEEDIARSRQGETNKDKEAS
ncbi:hypothetical protein [Paenibacillus rigui]|uniref:Uncharacterized protein n=1 Tax=Paenibacillus rigui TaxID=554312 RepID=A0A229UNC9_9BACL|nr:hypothetical protein [Paenibacillus rigui]OXM84997.1 hypothetical protein CF651_17410 [Paenibacillus rigui]